MKTRFRAAKVRRTLMAVSEMVKNGQRVISDQDDKTGHNTSHFVIKKTGQKIGIDLVGQVYEFPLEVEVPGESSGNSGQASRP